MARAAPASEGKGHDEVSATPNFRSRKLSQVIMWFGKQVMASFASVIWRFAEECLLDFAWGSDTLLWTQIA
jgi:hypothetical protein